MGDYVIDRLARGGRMKTKINQFIEHLAAYEGSPTVFNPWRDFDPQLDVSKEAPKWRREQLAKYLETRLGQSSYVIIAEAMGYQGGRFSGNCHYL